MSEGEVSEPLWRDVFLYFLLPGFINVGGPVAQITMMYNHLVEKPHWFLNHNKLLLRPNSQKIKRILRMFPVEREITDCWKCCPPLF